MSKTGMLGVLQVEGLRILPGADVGQGARLGVLQLEGWRILPGAEVGHHIFTQTNQHLVLAT